MYDMLTVEMPMPDGYVGLRYQTKDLHQGLNRYTLTADGRLRYEEQGWWPETYLVFDGILTFYDIESDDGHGNWIWHEYQVRFEKGTCQEIIVVANRKKPYEA